MHGAVCIRLLTTHCVQWDVAYAHVSQLNPFISFNSIRSEWPNWCCLGAPRSYGIVPTDPTWKLIETAYKQLAAVPATPVAGCVVGGTPKPQTVTGPGAAAGWMWLNISFLYVLIIVRCHNPIPQSNLNQACGKQGTQIIYHAYVRTAKFQYRIQKFDQCNSCRTHCTAGGLLGWYLRHFVSEFYLRINDMWNSINAECMVICERCMFRVLAMHACVDIAYVLFFLPLWAQTNEHVVTLAICYSNRTSSSCVILFCFINIFNCLLVWESTHAPTTFTHYCKPTHMMTILVGFVPQTATGFACTQFHTLHAYTNAYTADIDAFVTSAMRYTFNINCYSDGATACSLPRRCLHSPMHACIGRMERYS